MSPLKKFHQKASELLLETQTYIYNQSVYTPDPIYNIIFAHKIFITPYKKGHNPKTLHRSKLKETGGFPNIHAKDYSGYIKDIKNHIYLNGKNYRQEDISPFNVFNFVKLKKKS